MALKIGVVGLRGIGNQHADCHSKDPLAKLVAVCDVVKERADKAAARFGVKAYYSLKDMLANEDLDIVDVTTGGHENGSWHYEPAMEAMAAGKHVLVEKPISNDIHEAREMVRFAAEQDVYLGCNLNHYFTPTAEKARQYIDEGKVGEPVYVLHKVGFNGGEELYSPNTSTRFKGFPYAHLKAFLAHPFAVTRYFCGDITHIQAFVDRPSFRRRQPALRKRRGGLSSHAARRRSLRFGRLVELRDGRHARHVLHRELHREVHLLAGPHTGQPVCHGPGQAQ